MQKIFFYPHPNLRDRQLDTIRLWPKDDVLNPEVGQQKPYHYSAGSTLRRFIPPTWHQIIPAINLKLRPKAAPDNAIVYCWGGIISHGDFIIELDNPYILTGYNVKAFRLYRPILRALLLSKRCNQIRCISVACLETLRNELGDKVANKARVFYPLISDLEQNHMPSKVGDVPKLLFISTSFILKAGPSLLRVMRRLADQNIPCHLSLVTYLPDEYKAEADALPNVTVIPANQPRAELVKFYQTHDMLVHPTFMESFGMVVWEALAYGMAIVANDVYAISEMIVDNGSLIAPPISNWHNAMPTKYFAQTQAVQDAAVEELTVFEDQLANALTHWLTDHAALSRAKLSSQAHYRRLSAQPNYFRVPA